MPTHTYTHPNVLKIRLKIQDIFGIYIFIMAKIVKPLTDTKCASAKPKVDSQGKPVNNKLADGNGLYLIVRPSGRKTWQFIYGRKNYLNAKGKPTDGVITIGDYSKAGVKGVLISLDAAREKRKTTYL